MFESGLYIWLIIPSANLTDGFSIICSCVSLVCSVNLSNLIWQSVWSVHLFWYVYMSFVSICMFCSVHLCVWFVMSSSLVIYVHLYGLSICLVCQNICLSGLFCPYVWYVLSVNLCSGFICPSVCYVHLSVFYICLFCQSLYLFWP